MTWGLLQKDVALTVQVALTEQPRTGGAAPARGSPEAVEALGVAGCTTLGISPQNCSVQGASP